MKCKKFLAAVTAAALAVSSLASVTAFADDETESTTTLTADTSWYYSGDYTLYDADDLAGLAELVNGGITTFEGETITLANSIDCNYAALTPIGTYTNPFEGIFDGGGNTIKNATISNGNGVLAGLFGWVEGNATDSTEATTGIIKNLTLNTVDVTNTDTSSDEDDSIQACSGVAAAVVRKGLVSKVSTTSTCSVSGAYRVGGIVGSARDVTKVTSCKNKASVTGITIDDTFIGKYVGGIVGAAHDMEVTWIFVTGDPATITGCYNYGSVTGVNEVGGIVGYADQATVSDCHNGGIDSDEDSDSDNDSGTITATNGNYGVGGIIGFDAYNPRSIYIPSKGSDVTDCTNAGAVIGIRSAGIVGTLGVTAGQSQPSSDKTLTTITNCSNSGAITGTDGKCGAIFGYQITYKYGDEASDGTSYVNHLVVSISGCSNTGTVNGVVPSELTPSSYVE